jgi:hypothetical protein
MKSPGWWLVMGALLLSLTGRAEEPKGGAVPADGLCRYLITTTDDFIVEAYRNGQKIPDEKRQLLNEIFGATVERIDVGVQRGDWLVFHVVSNRLRWNGSKYFAVAGCYGPDQFGFESKQGSPAWSVCDDPAKARRFIRQREAGAAHRPVPIEVPWGDGDGLMRESAGASFAGGPIWGGASSTWIKYIAPSCPPEAPAPPAPPIPAAPARPPAEPVRHSVQILSAIYGTGGKDADVTARVKEYVETERRMFAANPTDLGADPNPYWNKGLHIVYMKDGVRREQHRNENEHILPESFYGPQDAAELRAWLPGTRWFGEPGELQFNLDETFTMPGKEGTRRWEALDARRLRLTTPEDGAADYAMDYTWSSFAKAGEGRKVFHLVP